MKSAPSTLAHDPRVLYQASIERIDEAKLALRERRWTLACYLSGLGVECILQAIVLRAEPTHDARHDLSAWLQRCPLGLQNALRSEPLSVEWNRLVRRWYDGLRYLSDAGLLGYLRGAGRTVGVKGGGESRLRMNSQVLLTAASAVHKKALEAWHRY